MKTETPLYHSQAAPCETGHELCPQVDTPEMGGGRAWGDRTLHGHGLVTSPACQGQAGPAPPPGALTARRVSATGGWARWPREPVCRDE